MKRKNQKKLSGIWLSLCLSLTSSCAIKPPDTPVCVELNLDKGMCTYTISDKDFEISEDKPYTDPNGKKWTWWELRPTMVYVPYPSWVEIKTFTIKMCKRYPKECKGSNVDSWDRKSSKIDAKIKPRLGR